MDIISFNEASTANSRIESFIENPDSTSGIVTVPKVIASGETVTIPAGRVAVLPNVQVDGVMNIEGEVFVPSGATTGDLDTRIALKADTTYVDAQVATRSRLVQGTVQNSTSGTSIDFTGIPSWVKKITVMFNGVSTNGTSVVGIQIGSSAGYQTSGYSSTGSGYLSASTPGVATFTTLFGTSNVGGATQIRNGSVVLHKLSDANFVWAISGVLGLSDSLIMQICAGVGSSGGLLDRIRITTVNGTDTFDAGQINIMYEG